PMLCVTAVNPFLLSKVPALLHVMSVRKKIGTMLPYVRCPFRRSINKGVGNRRYLLESNDFFALRDLIDLSKGVFAG
ncbi:phox (PX) domain protein, partial [Trifolium medium]|nr:phox (PX) domain protein [Trifolium medium]